MFEIFPTKILAWINFESTMRENSKCMKSVEINPQEKEKIIIIKTMKKINFLLIDFRES